VVFGQVDGFVPFTGNPVPTSPTHGYTGRLGRRTEARSRFDEKLTVVIVLALGVLLAPTPVGQGILNILGQLANGVTQASR
jgi:hypothetical protein